MGEFEIDKKCFNEKELDECALMQMKLIRIAQANKPHISFSVFMGMMLKPMMIGGTQKEKAMKIIEEVWDRYAEEYKRDEEEQGE